MIDENIVGFGVAGNFANHLEQAGESADFVNVQVDEKDAPKGIFPFYLKGAANYLGTFPLSNSVQKLSPGENVQMEPEVVLLCDVTYHDDKVEFIRPTHFAAYNDCSIRRPNVDKISEKKNWGPATKGVSAGFVKINRFSKGGVMDDYNIASFVRRDGVLHAYGEDVPVSSYSYMYQKLLRWFEKKFQTQQEEGPLEDVGFYLEQMQFPKKMLISIGATRYTEFGEHNYLQEGDESIVVLYSREHESSESVIEKLQKNEDLHDSTSILIQKVEA